MAVHNAEIAVAFDHLADLLEIDGANPVRVRAYRRAARTIEDLPRSAAEIIARRGLGPFGSTSMITSAACRRRWA